MSRPISQIIVHQTDTEDATVESVRNYHKNVLGWRDIGYHYLITLDGVTHKGRLNSETGAHCQGDNTDSIGICVVGKGPAFPVDKATGYMSATMFHSLVRLIRGLRVAYPTIGTNIWGHREKRSGISQGKTCPGFDCKMLRVMFGQGGSA